MKRLPVVYIAGPFRAPNAWQRKVNVHEAAALSLRVAEFGAMPLCPHKNTEDLDGTLDDQFWLDGTLELLRRCDAAIFTDRWLESSGAREEHRFCEQNGIEVFGVAHLARPGPTAMSAFAHWVQRWEAQG